MNPHDHIGQEGGDTDDRYLGVVFFRRQGDGIGQDDFGDWGGGNTSNRVPGQHGVGRTVA